MAKIVVVASVDQLNWLVRSFGPRIELRVSPESVLVATSAGELQIPATISYVQNGKRPLIVGIGGDFIADPTARTVRLFSNPPLNGDFENLLTKFVGELMKRAPRTDAIQRPVVIVKGLDSLPTVNVQRIRQALIRALADAHVVAVVIEPATS